MVTWDNSSSAADPYLRAMVEALSTQLAASEIRVAELEQEQRETRKVLAETVRVLLEREILTEEDRGWLGEWLSKLSRVPGEGLKATASRAAHRVVAKVRCGCGATVDVIAGASDVQCPWCGKKTKVPR
jgi:hypothetical protein